MRSCVKSKEYYGLIQFHGRLYTQLLLTWPEGGPDKLLVRRNGQI